MNSTSFKRFLNDEDGQASTEYILLLAIMSGMLVLLIKKLIQPAFKKLSQNMSNMIDKKLFGMDMHTFRVGL